MADLSPSELSVAEIQAEIAAISAEENALRQGSYGLQRIPVPAAVDTTPVRVTVLDSNGVPMSNFLPGERQSRYSLDRFSGSARPWGYARLEALARRNARLHAELSQRSPVQQ